MRDLIARIPTGWLSWLSLIFMVGVIALTEPLLSLLAFVCLVLTLAITRINHMGWCRRIQSGETNKSNVWYVDQPKPSLFILIWEGVGYLILTIGAAAALGRAGYRELTIVQWLLITIAASIWMPLWRVWLPMTYIITDQGVWVQARDSRTFLSFSSLDGAMHYPDRKSSTAGYISYVSRMRDFVMFFLKRSTWQSSKGVRRSRIVLLTPNDSREFMQHLPSELIVEEKEAV